LKVRGNVTIRLREDSLSTKLYMYINYKHPNKFFKRKFRLQLATTWENGEENFLKKSLNWLNDKESLVNLAMQEIKDDYYEAIQKSPTDMKEKQIKKLIKELNSEEFTVEVEINEL
jgi:hypothetical protein